MEHYELPRALDLPQRQFCLWCLSLSCHSYCTETETGSQATGKRVRHRARSWARAAAMPLPSLSPLVSCGA